MKPTRVISVATLRSFWELHPDAEAPLRAWYYEARSSDWGTPGEVKAKFGSASVIGDNRVVFNIKGNSYRLVVKINYPWRTIYIRFIGTHAEYDRIDSEEV